MKHFSIGWIMALACACLPGATAATAAVAIYTGDKASVSLGGLLQLQFKDDHEIGGNSQEDFTARRLRIEFGATIEKNWQSRLQLDFGQGGHDPSVMDAWIRYTGFGSGSLTFGNQYAPFSRELLTSAKYQELPERAFTGDHNYGVPDREPGVVFASSAPRLDYSIGWFHAGIKPSTAQIHFDSPFNDDGQYTGNLYAARLQYTPVGETVPYSQSDLDVELGLSFGLNAYRWTNDGNIQTATPGSDWDTVTGYGLDAAWRGDGFSADAGYNWIRGTSRDPATSTGIIRDGVGRLRAWAVKGGYMLMPKRLELVASLQGLRADAWNALWKRYVAGVNYFFDGDNLKAQFALEHDSDVNGVAGSDANIAYVQLQMAF